MILLKRLVGNIFDACGQSPTIYNFVTKFLIMVLKRFGFNNISHATNCEDLMVSFYTGKEKGFYVDIGALDPVKYSNTYLLYMEGWRGINIEPRKDCMERFLRYRQDDINLNIGIDVDEKVLKYYSFEEPAYNTILKERAEHVIYEGYSRLIEEYEIYVSPLSSIFSEYLPKNQQIDFLAIDVEGYEYNVLLSNDWTLYRPKFIAMESLISKGYGYDMNCLKKDRAVNFLLENGYAVVGKIRNKLFFLDKSYVVESI